jgi:hypothetical protein
MPPWQESGVTRTVICATVWRGATVFGMEMTWQLDGAYATWTLTVTAGPTENQTEYLDDWQKERFERLHLHFVDLVNLLEVGRELRNTPGYRLSYS